MESNCGYLALKTGPGVQIIGESCFQDEEILNFEITISFSRESVPTGTNIDEANLCMAATSSSCERVSTGTKNSLASEVPIFIDDFYSHQPALLFSVISVSTLSVQKNVKSNYVPKLSSAWLMVVISIY